MECLAHLLRSAVAQVDDDAYVTSPNAARAAKMALAACSPFPEQLCGSPRLVALHVLAGASSQHGWEEDKKARLEVAASPVVLHSSTRTCRGIGSIMPDQIRTN